MKYRTLGQTDLQVSEIGFGCWGIGGGTKALPSYGKIEEARAHETLQDAFRLGINFFDTADFYGEGKSEEILGRTFKNVREKVLYSTKAGFVKDATGKDFSLSHIEQSINGSLRRLETDSLDLFQLHDACLEDLEEPGLMSSLFKKKDTGLMKALGVSTKSPEDALKIVERWTVDFIQVNFNLVDQRALDIGLLDVCAKKRIGVVVKTPLCFGFLSGRLSATASFPDDDHRSRWSKDQIKMWAEAPRLFLSDMNLGTERTVGQFALQFCLSHPAVTTVIPGHLTKAEVHENAKASQLGAMSTEEMEKVRRTYKDHQFFIKRNP